NAKRFADLVRKTLSILEAHAVTGDFDYLLKARVADLQGLQRLINDVLLAHPTVDRVRSEIVLETLREDQLLELRYCASGWSRGMAAANASIAAQCLSTATILGKRSRSTP